MTGYTKLFGSIIASTIWREDDKTRIVWITMLAMANQHGDVEGSIPGLADMARVTIADVETALRNLAEPDAYSRTKDHEGRRIEEIDGGWHILNHAKYRERMNKDERREYLRRKQAERRARLKGVNNLSTNVAICSETSTLSTQAEAEAEAKEPTPKGVEGGFTLEIPVSPPPKAWHPTETQKRLNALFRRRDSTEWSKAELKAFKAIGQISDEDLKSLERYYRARLPDSKDYRRRDLATLLNNFLGEVDRSRSYRETSPI